MNNFHVIFKIKISLVFCISIKLEKHVYKLPSKIVPILPLLIYLCLKKKKRWSKFPLCQLILYEFFHLFKILRARNLIVQREKKKESIYPNLEQYTYDPNYKTTQSS